MTDPAPLVNYVERATLVVHEDDAVTVGRDADGRLVVKVTPAQGAARPTLVAAGALTLKPSPILREVKS